MRRQCRPEPRLTDRPIIVTARLDATAFAILDGLRRRHFPPDRNKIPAHLTLFHSLPGAEARHVLATIREVGARHRRIELGVRPPRSLGRGVAIVYEADELTALHRSLAHAWASWLTPQDLQPLKAHVTIQNKVTADEARTLLTAISTHSPIPAWVEGIDLWFYCGGPWEFMTTVSLG